MINKYTDAVKGFFENIFSDVSYEFKKGISIAIVAILVFVPLLLLKKKGLEKKEN